MFIELPIEQEKDDNKRERKITFPITGITIEDWYQSDRTTVVPNRCRISYNGQVHKCLVSKADLIEKLKKCGVEFHEVAKV
jgi:hypothetical protein